MTNNTPRARPRKGQTWDVPNIGTVRITWAAQDGTAVHYAQTEPPHNAGLIAPTPEWRRTQAPKALEHPAAFRTDRTAPPGAGRDD
jgi:hypothetical protein